MVPQISGSFMAMLGDLLAHDSIMFFAILAASVFYVAEQVAIRLADPKTEPGLYIRKAVGVIIPVSITFGEPQYFLIVRSS